MWSSEKQQKPTFQVGAPPGPDGRVEVHLVDLGSTSLVPTAVLRTGMHSQLSQVSKTEDENRDQVPHIIIDHISSSSIPQLILQHGPPSHRFHRWRRRSYSETWFPLEEIGPDRLFSLSKMPLRGSLAGGLAFVICCHFIQLVTQS